MISEMSRTLSLPTPPSGIISYPHTHLRAHLATIHRQYKPLELDDSTLITSSFVLQVVNLLDDECEDELKALLKDNYGMDEESVSPYRLIFFFAFKRFFYLQSSNNMSLTSCTSTEVI